MRQCGFSLVEVMVTLVIVSISALGMAGLQTATMRSNTNALLESQAATLAQDLIERIRANPTADYTTALGVAVPVGNVNCEGTAANCDVDDMRLYDLTHWKCSLGATSMDNVCGGRGIAALLPSGDGAVAVAANVYTITIRWYDVISDANRTLVITSVITSVV